MVEQNDNNNEDGTKRRGRLFGSRRARSHGPDDHVADREARATPVTPPASDAEDPGELSAPVASIDAPDAARVVVDEGDSVTSVVDEAASVTTVVDEAAQVTTVIDEVESVTTMVDAVTVVTATEAVPLDLAEDTAADLAPEATGSGVTDLPDAEPTGAGQPEAEPSTAEESAAEPAPTYPVATSTTSLIFHAPVLPDLPERFQPDDEPDRDRDRDRDRDLVESPSTRRRSRRRGAAAQDDQQADDSGVQQQRQPKQKREPELITEPQRIKGSTRLEAKKQRRRDGRDAGRRRQVITEDEFLARRESVDRQMIVRSQADRIEIGVLEDGVLAEHYVTKNHNVSLIGNVYLGKVQNVLPSMEAAFVDIGRGRNAVLYSGEVDWDSVETGNQPRRIELALKPGDKVLVQVTKDPVGHKGARLTSQISLPGRYLVYVPNGSMNGISRKLPDTERARLKKILKEVLPEHAGVIVRTAAEGATEEQLTRDVTRLTSQWEAIQNKVQNGQAPVLLHSEPDLLVKIVRDVFNEDFSKLIIDGDAARAVIDEYLSAVAPDLKDRVELYEGPDSFEEHRLNEQIEKALDRKVWLPSGGSLVIDRTEAMTVVDVNTGKFVGSGGNLEETVTKNNLEAAEEIVRQLRLRDIGGIIVVDFIDMVLESNRDLVLRRLVECLSRDRTKHQVAEVTSLGLVQMTRKKIGVGLQESFAEVNAKVNDNTNESSPKGGRSGRKGRGNGGGQGNGNGNGSGNGNGQQSSQQAHQITEDVKNALSRIAASTIPHDDAAATAASGTAPTSASQLEEALDSASGATPGEADAGTGTTRSQRRSRRGDRNERGDRNDRSDRNERADRDERADGEGRTERTEHAPSADATVEQPTEVTRQQPAAPHEPATPEPVSATREPASTGSRRVSTTATVSPTESVAILDIPLSAAPVRQPRPVSTEAAESLLDSVLQALPEPKQPGQGRNRSRRVTSGSISAPATTSGATDAGGADDAGDPDGGPVILGR
ncbi:ribonuclease E/G [Curtobacterium sp. MCBD17_013]|uniref:Rne/Rng family ribonuclease n=1 Tax=Curtobacterium sp. MCBD17_013 TaxID=2175668 RepID=UPI000DA80F70|nr:Rne/Rng family ribonuclease [Curtobacterium sp. MCBD17_013]PZF60620.1 ribonuclease E/G [Curtobacterium sp. MCBD17_013]